MEQEGRISALEIQVPFELKVQGHNICKYIADFAYLNEKGEVIVEDVKGYRKGSAYQIFRLKQKLMLAIYGIEVQVVT